MAFKCNTAAALYILLSSTSVIALVFGALSWSRTTCLFLPLPGWVPAGATILSPVTILAFLATRIFLAKPSLTGGNRWRVVLLPLLNHLHTILSSIMATVALAYLFPENTLACHLESQWQSFFQSKNSPVIRTIQDRFQCCGFRSIHDRAWPFKDRDHGDNACELQLGYQRSCLGPWREQQQRVSWMVFVAAIAMLAVKVGFVYISPSRVPWMNSRSRLRVPEYQQIADAPEEGQGRDGAGNADEDRATMLPQANQGFPTHWDVD